MKMKAIRFSLAVVVGLVAVLAALTLLDGQADVAWAQGGSAHLWTVNDDGATTPQTTPVSLNVLDNDSVVTGNVLRGHGVGLPINGTATITPDGTVTYTPTAVFSGTDTFTYTVKVCTDVAPYTQCTVITDKHGHVVIEVTPPEDVGGAASVLPPPTGSTTVITFTQSPDPQAPVPPVLEFPHGSITHSVVLVYREPITPTPPTSGVPDGFMFAGRRFSLELYIDGVLQSDVQFAVPVTLTLQYTDDDVAGLDEHTLAILYWDGSAWSSDGITVIERDTINNRITVSITHLTEFALFAGPSHVYLPIIMKSMPDLVVTRLTATANNVTVVIKNQGSGPVVDHFWVDVYFNPTVTPTLNMPWSSIGSHGCVWGVTTGIPSGSSLTLTTGEAYYWADLSSAPPLPVGAKVYAYVDSMDRNHTGHGNVLENDENNNRFGPVISTDARPWSD